MLVLRLLKTSLRSVGIEVEPLSACATGGSGGGGGGTSGVFGFENNPPIINPPSNV
jgi:hypothetical protein